MGREPTLREWIANAGDGGSRPLLNWKLQVRRLLMPAPIFRRMLPWLLEFLVYCILVDVVVLLFGLSVRDWGTEGAILNGVILGFLLSFRNNAAYDRWWEGRKLWGQLVNDSRNLCLKAAALVKAERDELARFATLVAGFADALRLHLRDQARLSLVPGFENSPENPAHVPLNLAGRIHSTIAEWKQSGKISEIDALMLDPHARAPMDICGACERIKQTPPPLSYRAILRHGIIVYLATTPWFLGSELGFWSIPPLMILVYFILGIELTAESVEEPFGDCEDDLDLERYCLTIRRGVHEALGLSGGGSAQSNTRDVLASNAD